MTEKDRHICSKSHPSKYAHVTTGKCRELIHVEIQNDESVLELVKDLVLCSSTEEWYEANADGTPSVLAEFRC